MNKTRNRQQATDDEDDNDHESIGAARQNEVQEAPKTFKDPGGTMKTITATNRTHSKVFRWIAEESGNLLNGM